MKIREGAYYRTRHGDVVGPMRLCKDQSWYSCYHQWNEDGGIFSSGADHGLDLISEVYVSDTPPSDDVMLNLSEIARTKVKAMGEGNFGMDENPPCGIRLRWLVKVVDRPHDTPPADGANEFQSCTVGTYAPETKTLRDEFAITALRGLVANPNNIAGTEGSAKWAYRYADAMMEARKK